MAIANTGINHSNWGEALWAATKDSASSVAYHGKALVTGQFEGCGGTAIPTTRANVLRSMTQGVSNTFGLHTFSLRDPKGFQQMQQSIADFQNGKNSQSISGPLGGFVGAAPEVNPRERR